MLLCKHCQKGCKSQNSLHNHERLCKENINRIVKPKSEKWVNAQKTKVKSNQWSNPDYKLSAITSQKLSDSGKKQLWTVERKLEHSFIMKKVVENNPESYTASNRGRTKQIAFDGLKFQGEWELDFYKYCKHSGIQIERPNEWFEYEWNGIRKYFPDFYLSCRNLYIEVKGYETDRDKAKWASFPNSLRIIRKHDIMAIRNGCFTGL